MVDVANKQTAMTKCYFSNMNLITGLVSDHITRNKLKQAKRRSLVMDDAKQTDRDDKNSLISIFSKT